MKEQDRCPIYGYSVTGNDGSPRVPMTSDCSQPPMEARQRQQDPCHADSCASTRLKRLSDGHVTMYTGVRHLSASHVAHSYTPIVHLDTLLTSIKGEVQGLPRGARGGRRRLPRDSLSRARRL
jgi:hypothetical protein